MKKALLIILALMMVISITACGGGNSGGKDGDNGDKEQKPDALQTAIDTYKLNMDSSEEQAMSEARATKDKLSALKNDFFKGTMMFEGTEFENLTYGDIKDQLGVDASYYYLNGEEQCFVWQAEGNDSAKLLISFLDGKLYGLGSANLGVSSN